MPTKRDSCPERERISHRVTAAIHAVYQILDEPATAFQAARAAAFRNARKEQQIALRELREHVQEHGCEL